MSRPKRPQCFTCNPSAATVGCLCGACFARRNPRREPAEDGGDPNVDGTDYEPSSAWAE